MSKDEALKEVRLQLKEWPESLWTGVMFYKGFRITREEFEKF